MNISYRKILNKNQLILSDFNAGHFVPDYHCAMITKNHIDGLLQCEINVIDNCPEIYYDISSKHSLSTFLHGKKLNYSLLSAILCSLYSACEFLESYMLDYNYLLLSPDFIYIEPESKKAFFCYCPIKDTASGFCQELKCLFDYCISTLDYTDKECISAVYSLHQKCVNDTFTMNDLLEVTDNVCLNYSDTFNKNNCEAATPDNSSYHNIYPHNQTVDATVNQNNNFKNNNIQNNINYSIRSNVTKNDNNLKTEYQATPSDMSSSDISYSTMPFSKDMLLKLILPFCCITIAIISGIFLDLYLHFIKKSISFNLFIIIIIILTVIFIMSLPYFNGKRKYYRFLSADMPDKKSNTSFFKNMHDAKNNTFFSEDISTVKTDNSVRNNDDTTFSPSIEPEISFIGETVLISRKENLGNPMLIYSGNEGVQDIIIDHFPFTIGKLRESCDYIMDNSLISRLHATIYIKNGEYYIEDLNSSNGTAVNKQPLSPHSMTQISSGDTITLAHLNFIFKL